MSLSENNEKLEEIHEYCNVFPEAWKRVLKKIEEGEIFHPGKGQEAVLRYHLFAECLLVMREEMFSVPYLVSAEVEMLPGKRVDLTLGLLDEKRPLVGVEMKCFPTDLDIISDLMKIGDFVKNGCIICGFFAMIGDKNHISAQSLDLTALGIQEENKHSFYEWQTLKPRFSNVLVEALIVGFMSQNQMHALRYRFPSGKNRVSK